MSFASPTTTHLAAERRGPGLLRGAMLVLVKDLRIEASSRVVTNQVIPFAGIVLLMFAFAVDPARQSLQGMAPGLFWIAVVLAAVLAVSRATAVENENGARDALRLSGLDPAAVFLGKVAAVAIQLVLLEVVLVIGVVVLYGFPIVAPGLLPASAAAPTVATAAAGVLYATLAGAIRSRETLLPLLALPVLAPVVLGAARAWSAAGEHSMGEAWRWVQLLTIFAAVLVAFGVATYSGLLEEA
ncbi:MAG: heme exporter protein [Frankiaceae bacterium]|nr:heme exporter protein [Frankiaceae bacterium]